MTDKSKLEQDYKEYLESLPIVSLRVLGRFEGVAQVCATNKETLVAGILDILMGRVQPSGRSKRGAPPKQTYLDPVILEKLSAIKQKHMDSGVRLSVASPEYEERGFAGNEVLYKGILEMMYSGYGFLRAKNCQPSMNGADVFIPAPAIHSLKLREGDYVTCTAKPRQKNDSPALDILGSVNGVPAGGYENRPYFDNLTAQYANRKIALSKDSSDLSLRILDLFIPIGKGQRGLIIAPPKAGKTTLLKAIAGSVSANHKEIELIVLLIDERPEEVTDFKQSVPAAKIIYSTFDEGAEKHIRAAHLTVEHAKRLVEMGKDVVILLDSLTKLTRACNYLADNTGKTLSGGLEASALNEPKSFFGAARNTVEQGSLTILATVLVDTGSRMDDIIYEEFKGTGNADIFLSRELAERRVFPAIDIRRSGTRKEELLLSAEEIAAVYKMRERGITENAAGLFDMMRRTADNEEFISRIPEWLKIYKAL